MYKPTFPEFYQTHVISDTAKFLSGNEEQEHGTVASAISIIKPPLGAYLLQGSSRDARKKTQRFPEQRFSGEREQTPETGILFSSGRRLVSDYSQFQNTTGEEKSPEEEN